MSRSLRKHISRKSNESTIWAVKTKGPNRLTEKKINRLNR